MKNCRVAEFSNTQDVLDTLALSEENNPEYKKSPGLFYALRFRIKGISASAKRHWTTRWIGRSESYSPLKYDLHVLKSWGQTEL